MMASEHIPRLAEELPELREVLHAALSRVEGMRDETRGSAADLLAGDPERTAFNQSLIRSMTEQIDVWEKQKPFDLRISQLRGMHKLVQFLERGGNEHNIGYFRQPTGAGKTVLYSLMAFLLNRKTVIFVPTGDLLGQTWDEMTTIGIPETSIGIVGAGKYEPDRQFLIVTYASHNSKMRSDDVYTQAMNQREVIVCDEAHRSLGTVTRDKRAQMSTGTQAQPEETVVETEDTGEDDIDLTDEDLEEEEEFFTHMEETFQARKNILTLGFTATSEMVNKSVHDHFHEMIEEEDYLELWEAGILVPYTLVPAKTSSVYDDEVDYISREDEAKILERENVYDKLHDALVELKAKSGVPIFPIAFCSSQAECLRYQKSARKKDLICRIITGKESKAALKSAERELLKGNIHEIVTINRLTTGWNLRPLNCAIIARASQSPATIVQGVGRTSRSFCGDRVKSPTGDAEKDLLLHTFLDKKESFVIETEWVQTMRESSGEEKDREKKKLGSKKEKGGKKSRRGGGSKPLDFIQALAISGQKPDGFVRRADNKAITYTLPVGKDDLHEGRKVCTVPDFLRTRGGIPVILFYRVLREGKTVPVPRLTKGTESVYIEEELHSIEELLQTEEGFRFCESNEDRESLLEYQKNPHQISYRADADGHITIPTDGGERPALTARKAGLMLGIADSLKTPNAATAIMAKHGYVPIDLLTVMHTGVKTNAYFTEDVETVMKLHAIDRRKTAAESPDMEGKVTIDLGEGVQTHWTDDGFEISEDLPAGFVEAAAKRLKIQPKIIKTGGKTFRVYEETTLRAWKTLIPKNDKRLDLPDLRNREAPAVRTCMGLTNFARLINTSLSIVAGVVQKKGIKAVTSHDTIDANAVQTIPDHERERKQQIVRISDPMRGDYYLQIDHSLRAGLHQDSLLTLKTKDEEQTTVYWLDELEEAMKAQK